MTRQESLRRQLERLFATHEPMVMAAFFRAIGEIVDAVELAAVIRFIERGDVQRAIDALNIDAPAFRALDIAIMSAYEAGGGATVANMPTFRVPDIGRVILRFNVRNLRAEQELSRHSSNLVTAITNDIRVAVRQELFLGAAAGQNPRQTALNIVGSINRVTGRREGGIIGLTSQQQSYVSNARAELLSGDPAQMQNYLGRVRRDRRFDRTVAAAIRDGKALDRDTVSKLTARYSDRLLQLRGETVARTETLWAFNSSQQESWKQMADTGVIPRSDIRKVWVATKDTRVRDSHASIDGLSVGLDEAFPNGMMHPGDPAGGPGETINCRCTTVIRVVQGNNQPVLQ